MSPFPLDPFPDFNNLYTRSFPSFKPCFFISKGDKMKCLTSCLLLFQLLIFNTAPAQVSSPPDYTSFINKYRSVFTDEMKANHIAGLSIAIVDGDSLVWCEGFGYYNEKEKKPVTGQTPLNIGSICKTFTGLAVLQLQEQGKLNIDRPFKSYIPEFRMKSLYGSVDSIPVRDFMTHHAGVPDFIRDKLSDNPPYFTTVLDYVNNDYATSAPNTVSAYSNAGISLLGNLIEKVSGESYFSVVQKQILDPLDMTESGFTTGMLPEPVSLGYNSRGEEMKELKVLDAPVGCLYSSAYDMAKYIKAMLKKGTYKHHQLISPASFAEMTRIQNEDVFLDFGNPAGLTWTIYFNDAGKCIEHAGGTINHRAELCIAPDAGIGIIIMSNSSNGGTCMYRENYDLFSEILKLKGQNPVVSVKPVPNKRHPEHHFKFRDNEKPVLTELPSSALKEIAGQYGTFGMIYSIDLIGNRLHTNI